MLSTIHTEAIEFNRHVGPVTIRIAEAMNKGWSDLKSLGFTIDPNLENKPITRFMVNSSTMKISPYSGTSSRSLPLWKIKANQRKRKLELLASLNPSLRKGK